jgi:hypothetical protein
MKTFPSVISSVVTDRITDKKVSELKKRRVADVEVLAGHIFPKTSPTDLKTTARTLFPICKQPAPPPPQKKVFLISAQQVIFLEVLWSQHPCSDLPKDFINFCK